MKFKYKDNPLATEVILDQTEILLLESRLYADQLEWVLLDVADGDISGYEEALRKALDETKRILPYYLEDLLGEHCGDCTAVPTSCTKCAAEDLLQISTNKLDKHAAYKIQRLFRKHDNINSAINDLESLTPDSVTDKIVNILEIHKGLLDD